MCGIAAFAGLPDSTDRSAKELVGRMLGRMRARGPDAVGSWVSEGVVLGHRRLAILDLDPRSDQPMTSTCGRYTITYNGEIYNFRDLRRELEKEGTVFRTTSDTEVMLALFARDGEAMLSRLHGMFAFVIWDRMRMCGFVARDPYGIKPLYFVQTSEGVLVASQVKALLASGKVSRAPDSRGQAGFWLLGSVPEPLTWYRDIRALPAGHCAWIDSGRMGAPRRWCNISAAWRESAQPAMPLAGIQEHVRAALQSSVAAHLVADVPVGVFLSGGIDSGALAGLMVEAGVRNLQGVTIAFQEFAGRKEDETPMASRIAAHYGIRHHVRVITRDEFNSDIPRILRAMDQPSIDGINTWYASKAVAELGLKVVVSGIGGDELFQGYSIFRQLPRLVSAWRLLSSVPGAMGLAGALSGVQARLTGNGRWNHLPDWARSLAGAWWLRRGLFSPAELPALMGEEMAMEGLRHFDPQVWVGEMSGALAADPHLALGQIESTTYLRNQLLRDSDWASMDHSVELRTPLVDAWLLRELRPYLSTFAAFPKKALLAKAPVSPLPKGIAQRGKTGFGIPLGPWLGTTDRLVPRAVEARDWARRIVQSYEEGLPP